MDYVIGILGLLIAAGVGLAIYEKRRKRTLLRHDLRQQPPASPHMMAERERAIHRPGSHGGLNEPHMH